jgi:KDO2-lipid IV(A) lauroyltransferase
MAKKPTSNYPVFKASFLCPKYWPLWLGIGFLRIINFLPYSIQYQIGLALGKLLFLISKKRRKIAAKNIQLCFPELADNEQQKLLKEHFKNLGMTMIESGIAWWGDYRKNPENPKEKSLVSYKGLEHIESALDSGKGVLILSPHFTSLEMTGLFVSFVTQYHPVYRPHNNELMDYLIRTGRSIPTVNQETGKLEKVNPIANSDTRQMLKVLKRGESLVLLPDQRYRSKGRVIVPFCGHDAKSNPATSKIAKLTDCLVVTVFGRRTEGIKYEVEFLPAMQDFPGESLEEDTIRLHQLYEEEIKRNPTQYLWVHNRWDLKKL